MSNKARVYITFPNNDPDYMWIQKLIESLEFSIHKVIRSGLKIEVKNKDFESITSRQEVTTLDFFLLFLSSSGAEEDRSYQKELQDICEILCLNSRNQFDSSRIFKILTAPNDNVIQPECLKQISGYNFYEYSRRRKNISKYDFELSSTKIWSRVLDLVYDMNDTMLAVQDENSSLSEHFVYLGSCCSEQEGIRDDIRRELQHYGFRILPMVELPKEEARLQETVFNNLRLCNFIIQIVGENYGVMTPEGKYSIHDIESQTIRKFILENSDKNQFIWIPSGMKITDSKQDLFINRLKRDDSSLQSEIIETTPEEFKNIIARFLESGEQPETGIPAQSVYLITKQNSYSIFIEKAAKDSNISVISSVNNNQIVTYQNHLKILGNINNVIIYYDRPDAAWFKSKIGDAIKAMGKARKTPFKQFAVVSKSNVDLSEYTPWIKSIVSIPEDDIKGLNNFFSKTLE